MESGLRLVLVRYDAGINAGPTVGKYRERLTLATFGSASRSKPGAALLRMLSLLETQSARIKVKELLC